MAVAGLGVSLAGFAGLIAALEQRPEIRSAVQAWRIRNIVIGGFLTTFAGFGVIATNSITRGDVELTIRVAGILIGIAVAVRGWNSTRPGPAWPTESGRRFGMVANAATALLFAGAAVIARVGLLQAAFLVQLSDPVSIFYNTVKNVTQQGLVTDEQARN